MSEHTPEFLAQYLKNYGSRWNPDAPDYSRCAKGIYSSMTSSPQCSRKNGHGPHGAWCKQHDPDAKKARVEKERQAYLEKRAQIDAADAVRRKQEAFGVDCQVAIREIAAGHNDPRALAQSVIDKLESET